MKRGLIILVQVLMLAGLAFAQVPPAVPFQAVVRDASGNLLLNQPVCVQFTVQGPPPTNTIEYQETQTTTTNKLGLLNVNVGAGTANLTYASTLAGVNWAAGAQYLDVAINITGTCISYTDLGAAQLLSVPYALYAGNASSVSGAASGDLGGNYPNPSVVKIQGVGVTATPTPVSGQVLEFNGSYWTPATNIGNTTSGTILTGLNVSVTGATSVNATGAATTTIGSATSTTTVSGPAVLNDGLTETGNVAITTSAGGTAVINDPSPAPSAVLDLYSTTQGFLPPRVTTAQEAAISNPANGLLVYNTTTKCLDIAHSGVWESVYCNCPNLSPLNAISGSTTVCAGSNNTYTVAAVQGATSYNWSVTGNPVITGNGTNSISFNAPALTSYTVSVTAVNACASSSVGQSILVNDFTNVPTTPTWNATPAASVCTGATVGYAINSSETGVNGTSAQNYTWNISATGSATALVNGQTASSGNPLVFSNTGTTAYTFVYGSGTGTIVISVAGNNTCGTGNALTQTITVDAQPALTNPAPAIQTVCTNGAIGAISTTPSGGTGTISYQWYSNTSNANTGGTSLNSTNGAQTTSYTPPARATTGTIYYYMVMSATGAGCNTATTSSDASVSVVVQPALTSPTPASETVCTNGAINTLTSTSSGGTGTIAYQWYSASSNVNTGGTLISGANSTSYTPPATATIGTTYYYVVVTATGSGCNNASSALNDASVTVVAQPSITNPTAASQTVCTNATISLSATGGNGAGTTTYTWYNNGSTNSTSGGTVVGSNSASYSPNTASVGGPTYYYVTYGTSGSGCITATVTATANVTVVAQPSITNPTPASQSLCINGTPTNLSATGSGGTGTATYQWVNNGSSNSESGGSNVGTNSGSYTPSVATAGTTYYYVKYSTSGAGCNTATATATASVTVAALPSLGTPTPAVQTICANAGIGAISTTLTGGTGTISYQWFEVGSNTNSGGTAVSGANSSSFTPATISSAGAYYYYATVTASGSGCGSATSPINDGEVVIVSGSPGTPSFTGAQSLTEGAGGSAYTVTASNGTSGYSWAMPTGWSPATGSGTSNSLTPPTAASGIADGGSVNISVTATNACGTTSGTYAVYVHGSTAYAYNASYYTVPVPAAVNAGLTITMSGAGGGSTGYISGTGGAGAALTATYNNAQGNTLYVFVGGAGGTPGAGYNGGGSSASENYSGGGGGGATDIRLNATGLANRVLVAAGGGGGGYNGGGGGFVNGGGGGSSYPAGTGGNVSAISVTTGGGAASATNGSCTIAW